MSKGANKMIYKITQALNDLKNFYGLEDFHEVNLNMENRSKPVIKFKSGDDKWVLTLTKVTDEPSNEIHEEGENGVL